MHDGVHAPWWERSTECSELHVQKCYRLTACGEDGEQLLCVLDAVVT